MHHYLFYVDPQPSSNQLAAGILWRTSLLTSIGCRHQPQIYKGVHDSFRKKQTCLECLDIPPSLVFIQLSNIHLLAWSQCWVYQVPTRPGRETCHPWRIKFKPQCFSVEWLKCSIIEMDNSFPHSTSYLSRKHDFGYPNVELYWG